MPSTKTSVGIVLTGAALVLAGAPLTWISAGIGDDAPTYDALDFISLWVPAGVLPLVVVVLTLSWVLTRDGRFALGAAFVGGLLLLICAVTVGVVEVIGTLIPTSFLPVTLRRSTVTLSAGPGLWMAASGAAIVVLGATPGLARRLYAQLWAIPQDRDRAVAGLGLLGLLVLAGWLRYEPWLGSSLLSQQFDLSGQAAPWVGPMSLFAIWLLAAGLVLLAVAKTQAAGLISAAAGWLITFVAAIAIVWGESLAHLRLHDLVNAAPPDGITFHATTAVWLIFSSGVAIAAIGAYLVSWRPKGGSRDG